MTLARIKKGDDVIVLAGRERGKRGVVRQVMPKQGTALVQDINISKRHMKPTGTARQAGIVDKEQPIQLSNLALVDPKTSKPTRDLQTCALQQHGGGEAGDPAADDRDVDLQIVVEPRMMSTGRVLEPEGGMSRVHGPREAT